jgi:hypothetical protein
MNFFASGNKVFYILEFPKCHVFKGNAIPENIESIFADELLQDCVIDMSDVAADCVFPLYFPLYISAHCIYLHFNTCKLFNLHLMDEMPYLYKRCF